MRYLTSGAVDSGAQYVYFSQRVAKAVPETEQQKYPSWLSPNSFIGLIQSLALLTLFSAICCTRVDAQPIRPEAMRQIRALLQEKVERTPAQRKISSHLIYANKLNRGQPVARGVNALQTHVPTDSGGRALVDVHVSDNDPVVNQIGTLGGEVVNSFAQYHVIRAWMPLDTIEDLAGTPAVIKIKPAERPIHRKINTSEGDIAHRANLARSQFGVNGSGVKIGVLSDSVDHLATVQSTGDVGAVTVLSGQSGTPGTGEGTAMLEVVSDLAPGASLFFATADGGEAGMATNIQALRDAGCDILVDDTGYLSEPVFQDGIIGQAIETVAASGALFFSAAGNSGNKDDGTSGTWEGDFSPSEDSIDVGGGNLEPLQSFDGSSLDTITDQPPDLITLQWSDAFGASGNDYDLFLINGQTVVDASTDYQTGADDPIEAIDVSKVKATGFG